MSDELGDLLKDEDPKNISTLAIVSTVVSTLNDVIDALREEIVALGDSEKNSRRNIMIFMSMLMVAAIASVAGVWTNYTQGRDVKSIVHYIQECQQPDSECKRRNDEAVGKAVLSISTSVFDSISCVLSTLPEDRTDTNILACRDKNLGATKK